MTKFLLACVISCLVSLPPALAQIETPERVALGSLAVARSVGLVPAEADAAYAWHIETRTPGGRCAILEVAGTPEAHYWATVGKHRIYLVEAVADVDGIRTALHVQDIEIVGSVPPPPDPIDDTLADLVSVEAATVLAEFHADWSASVRSGEAKPRSVFDSAYQSTRRALSLQGVDRAYNLIDARLAKIEGADTTLADALAAISREFSSVPTPPDPVVPTAGPRVVLIVHETADSTPHTTGQFIKLRSGTESQYLRDKGHKLFILDDDMTDADGNAPGILSKYKTEIEAAGLPVLLIIDPKTEQLLDSRQLVGQWTAANVTEYIRQAGG